MRPRRRAVVLSAAVGLYYALLGLVILTPDAVYSGDIGVQFVQARALLDHRFVTLDIDYPGEFLDPERTFFPIRPPFVFTAAGATQSIFPPVSAALQAIGVSAFGLAGMVLISVIAGWATVYCSARLAPPHLDTNAIVALGFASPLWFYAVSGWHHAAGMALGTAAFVFALCSRPGGWAGFLSGLALGAGAALRDEVILLAPGLVFAVWSLPANRPAPRLRRSAVPASAKSTGGPPQPSAKAEALRVEAGAGRHTSDVLPAEAGSDETRRFAPILLMCCGALLSLSIAAAVEVWWFDRPAAAHLRHAVHLLQKALATSDAPNPDIPVLEPMSLRQRYETVVQYWLLGYGRDRLIALYAAGLILALFVRAKSGSSAGILLWLVAIVILAAQDLWELVTAPKWLAGLYRVAPYLVFGLLPAAAASAESAIHAKAVPRIALMTLIGYVVIAFAGVDTTGGKGLGPRLLLPLLPLLTVAAVIRIHGYFRGRTATDRWVGGVGLLLLAMTLVMHVYGTTVAYYMRNRDDAAVLRSVAASRERIVIADDVFTAQLLFPLYYRKIVFLADSQASVSALASRLMAERVPGALIVSRARAAKDLTGFRVQRNEQLGRMRIAHWVR